MGLEEAQAIYDDAVLEADTVYAAAAEAAVLAREELERVRVDAEMAQWRADTAAEEAALYAEVTAEPRRVRDETKAEALRVFNETKGVTAV